MAMTAADGWETPDLYDTPEFQQHARKVEDAIIRILKRQGRCFLSDLRKEMGDGLDRFHIQDIEKWFSRVESRVSSWRMEWTMRRVPPAPLKNMEWNGRRPKQSSVETVNE